MRLNIHMAGPYIKRSDFGRRIKQCETYSPFVLSALVFHITVPHAVAEAERSVLEAAVKGCPVGAAIAPSVEKKISWTWAE